MLEDGKFASEHDGLIARKLAFVLTGGDFSVPQWVDEQHILDLEREAAVSLAMEPKTVEADYGDADDGQAAAELVAL